MDIVQSNFQNFADEVTALIPLCKFVSFDLELTGIRNDPFSPFDLPMERYQKMTQAANKYKIIQFGMTLFLEESDNCYEVYPYNVYLFPQDKGFSQQIVLDTSAIEFNKANGMDYQKWIYEGVPYMTTRQAEYYYKQLFNEDLRQKKEQTKNQKNNKNNNQKMDIESEGSPKTDMEKEEIKIQNEAQKKIAEEEMANFTKWIKSSDNQQVQYKIYERNPFLRRYYYEQFEKFPEFNECCIATTLQESANSFIKYILIEKYSKEEKKKVELQKKQEKEKFFLDAKGFTRIFDELADNRVQLIGHNCLFDLMFTLSHFKKSLKSDYPFFKQKLHKYFPLIYDTKVFANNLAQFKQIFDETGTSLEAIYNATKTEQYKTAFFNFEIKFPDQFKKYNLNDPNTQVFHEAGYDSLITGIVFLKISKMLDQSTLQKYENLVNFNASSFVLNTNGNDLFNKKYDFYALPQQQKSEEFYQKISKAFNFKYNLRWQQGCEDQKKQMYLIISLFERYDQREQFQKDIEEYNSKQEKPQDKFLTLNEYLKVKKSQALNCSETI